MSARLPIDRRGNWCPMRFLRGNFLNDVQCIGKCAKQKKIVDEPRWRCFESLCEVSWKRFSISSSGDTASLAPGGRHEPLRSGVLHRDKPLVLYRLDGFLPKLRFAWWREKTVSAQPLSSSATTANHGRHPRHRSLNAAFSDRNVGLVGNVLITTRCRRFPGMTRQTA